MMMQCALILFGVCLSVSGTSSSTPVVVSLFGRYEVEVSLDKGMPSNPFSINSSVASMLVVLPNEAATTVTVVPFYFQNFTRQQALNGSEILTPQRDPFFLIRFSPEILGVYTFELKGCSFLDGSTSGSFTSVQGSYRDFVRVSKSSPQYFESGDNIEFLIGENIAFPGRDPIILDYNYSFEYKYANMSTYMYDHYLQKIVASGGNYVRLWLGLSCNASSATPISLAGGTHFGRYDLKAAWRLDYILTLAESLRVNVLFCFETQQSLQMLFPASVYASHNGGPLTTPNEYFTSVAIRAELNDRLQYAISRYAHSTSLFSWQFFNEFDDFPHYDVDVASEWMKQLTTHVKTIDHYHHLIHNSFGGADVMQQQKFWPYMDFATFHQYNVPDFAAFALDKVPLFQRASQKPVFWGEFGFSGGSFGGDNDGELWWKSDVSNLHIHNAMWASAVSTAAGGPAHWWWDEFDDHNAYTEFATVRAFINRIPLRNRSWVVSSEVSVKPSETPAPTPACNSTENVGVHFPTDEGKTLGHYSVNATTNGAVWCGEQCCANTQCTGWLFTTNQTGGNFPPCEAGTRCCWLKQGVTSLVPQQNCTAGFARAVAPNAVARVMVGALSSYRNNNNNSNSNNNNDMIVSNRSSDSNTNTNNSNSTNTNNNNSNNSNTNTSHGDTTPRNDSMAMWVYNSAHTWKTQHTAAAFSSIAVSIVSIPHMTAGAYTVNIVDTTDGHYINTMNVMVNETNVLAFELPAFIGDIAARATINHSN